MSILKRIIQTTLDYLDFYINNSTSTYNLKDNQILIISFKIVITHKNTLNTSQSLNRINLKYIM